MKNETKRKKKKIKIKGNWVCASLQTFHSHLSNSDVDLMIYNTIDDNALSRLYEQINKHHSGEFVLIKFISTINFFFFFFFYLQQIFFNLYYIPQAKTPVLKLTTQKGEVKLDICVSNKDDPPNSVKIAQYPYLFMCNDIFECVKISFATS